jgi:hypothetical protein
MNLGKIYPKYLDPSTAKEYIHIVDKTGCIERGVDMNAREERGLVIV